MSIISLLRSTFEEHRAAFGDPNLTDLECFQAVLLPKLSRIGKSVLQRAHVKWTHSEGLLNHFLKEISGGRPSSIEDTEKLMLNASIAFEYAQTKADANRLLSEAGLSRINRDFYFLKEFVGDENGDGIGDFCDGSEFSALTSEVSLSTEQKVEKSQAYFLPFWPFFVAVCRALGEKENEITPMDAL